jgi:hypothetical protein
MGMPPVAVNGVHHSAIAAGATARKMADFCGFYLLRTLRSSAFLIDNGSRERNALAAFGLHPHRTIGLARRHRSRARGFAHFTFADRITHAYHHKNDYPSRPLRWS